MASSGNFCTINPLGAQGGGTTSPSALSNGNTAATIQTDTLLGNFGVTSGKWYWEWALTGSSTSGQAVGWANQQVNTLAELGYNSPSSATGAQIVYMYLSKNPPEIISDAPKSGSSGTDSDMSAAIAQNDIIGLAADFDNDKWYFSINGSFTNMRSGQNPSDGSNPMCSASGGGGLVTIARTAGLTWFPAMGNWSAATRDIKVNFGQDSTFSGSFSAGGNADGNGFGDFKYSVPTGFLALCSANVPTSDDIDPAGDDGETENPTKQFNILTYTGNSTTGQSLTGLGFKPDLIWAKCSSHAQNNQLYDSSRMNTRGTPTPFGLRSDTNGAEFDDQSTGNTNPIISSFDTDGFTLGTSGSGPNDSGREYVAWCWKANGGTTATNNEGNHTCTLQANAKAGFSIMTLGNYTSASGVTIGHGLDTAPAFYIHKSRASSGDWHVYHKSLGATKALILNSKTPPLTAIGYWANTEPTADVLSLGNTFAGTNNGVVYAWSEVEGYSKFGKYMANSNADGPFIYTGFRPRMVFIKMGAVEQDSWYVMDTERSKFNQIDKSLRWNLTDAEQQVSHTRIDFLSNGFKIRNNEASLNSTSYDPYYWGAWGDVPFKYNNTF